MNEKTTNVKTIYFELSKIGVPFIEFVIVYKKASSIPIPVNSFAMNQHVIVNDINIINIDLIKNNLEENITKRHIIKTYKKMYIF